MLQQIDKLYWMVMTGNLAAYLVVCDISLIHLEIKYNRSLFNYFGMLFLLIWYSMKKLT